MKKVIFAALLCIIAVSSLMAQGNADPLPNNTANSSLEKMVRKITEETLDAMRVKLVNSTGSLFAYNNPAYVSNIAGFRDTIVTDTIASSGSLATAVNFANRRLKTIYMPAAWTTAGLSFQVRPDGVTYYDFYSDDIEFTMVAGASYALNVNPRIFVGIQYLKIRSGTTGTPVTQAAQRVIKLKIGNY